MSWCRLILGLGLVKLVAAAAGATTTSTVPTKTNCPLYYLTPAVPSPTKSSCGVAGVLGKPNVLRTYCDKYIPGLGDLAYTDDNTICYRACARDPKCVAYSLDPAHLYCYTYGKSLADMAFQPNSNKYHFFYNLRDCYNCTLPPPPARSACASDPQPKSPQPVNYTCGSLGYVTDPSRAVFSGEIYGPPFTPRSCYELCVTYYDPVGVCESFAENNPVDFYPTCYIFDKPLREVGFVQNSNGNFRGWNLRGCYNCNTSYPPVPSCTLTKPPFNIGVRNGNFQDTYYDSSSMAVKLQEWTVGGSALVALGTNGNKFVNMTHVHTGKFQQPEIPFLSQAVYGLDVDPKSPGRFYNFSFDLAIPGSYHNTKPACNLRAPGVIPENANSTVISADNRTYAGTTFRRFGPILIDVAGPARPMFYVSIEVSCFEYDDTRRANATFWIDNIRLTKNGRDVGF